MCLKYVLFILTRILFSIFWVMVFILKAMIAYGAQIERTIMTSESKVKVIRLLKHVHTCNTNASSFFDEIV